MSAIVSRYVSVIGVAIGLVLLVAFGYQAHRISSLKSKLRLTQERSANYESAAKANYDVLTRIKSDFNSSLNSCFNDYANLSQRFDDYRVAIATAASNKPKPKEQNATCKLGGQDAISSALNSLNP
ncbi:MAG: hypothetical protein LBN32_01155 [Helicobacteraceae bacterium]|jgi:hypothetical protein|nr:hypothetical protein [Helicobacteraceae bacterium]